MGRHPRLLCLACLLIALSAAVGLLGIGVAVSSLTPDSPVSYAEGPTVITDRPEYQAGEIVLMRGTDFAPLVSLDVVVIRPDGSIVTGDGTDTPGWDTLVTDATGAFHHEYQTAWRGEGDWTVHVYDPADIEHAAILATTTFIAHEPWSGPAVTTDKPLYQPTESAVITGVGFDPGISYEIPVIRPDGSIATGDGTGTVGWDTIVADSSGNFTYYYQLDGIAGTYKVEVHPIPWGGPGSGQVPLASTPLVVGVDPPCGGVYRCFNSSGRGFDPGLAPVPILVEGGGAYVGENHWQNPFPSSAVLPADDASGDLHGLIAKEVYFSVFSSWSEDFPPGVVLASVVAHFQDGGSQTVGQFVVGQNVAEWSFERPWLVEHGCVRHYAQARTLVDTGNITWNWWTNQQDPYGRYYWGHNFFARFALPNRPLAYFELVVNPGAFGQKLPRPNTSCPAVTSLLFNVNPNGMTLLLENPTLTVIKRVINDNGGTTTASDFTMSVTGNNPSPASFPGTETPGTNVTLNPGVYSVSETGPSGYTASYSADCTGSIAAGESKTCTVTNDDVAPGHIVIDKVTDPSGSPQSFEFTLKDGPSGLDQAFSLTDAAAPHDSGAVLPGTGYKAEETVPYGWDLASASCDDGSPANNIDVGPGETVTCTFTNTLPSSVGGIVDVRRATSAPAAQQPGSAAPPYAALAGVAAAGALAFTAAAWYARRRWAR